MSGQGPKPCPGCGSERVRARHETADYMATHCFCACDDCSYRGPILTRGWPWRPEYDHEAVLAWNRGHA